MKSLLIALSCVVLIFTATSSATGSDYKGPKLASQARYVAIHGGILGSHWGQATEKTKRLVIRVYQTRFAKAGVWAMHRAVCTSYRESGFNPGAISDTGDYGPSQMNKLAHYDDHPDWYHSGRGFQYLIFDPWKAASEMLAMSKNGTSWTPWNGGQPTCPIYPNG